MPDGRNSGTIVNDLSVRGNLEDGQTTGPKDWVARARFGLVLRIDVDPVGGVSGFAYGCLRPFTDVCGTAEEAVAMNTQTKAASNRPMSPHLQVYALHTKITSLLSILHRIAGAGLMVAGTLFFLLWIVAAGYGEGAFTAVQNFYGSFLGFIVLFGWTVLLFYHFANGIRHLLWDTGFGFDLPTLRMTGFIMLGVAAGLSVVTWVIGIIVFVV